MRQPLRQGLRQGRGSRIRLASLVALTIIVLGAPASAINITFGDVVAGTLQSYGFTSTGSVLSFDGGTTDQLYQMFGYIGNGSDTVRINGANFDIATGINQTAPDTAMSSVTLDANGAAALGLNVGDLTIDYLFTLVNDTTPADMDGFLWDVAITNNSASDMNLTMYQYLDLDLDGASDFGDDSAVASTSAMLVTDSTSGNAFNFRAANGGTADHFQVEAFNGGALQNLLDTMGPAQDLSDSLAVFGPADFTGAFQYDFFIPAGMTFVLGGGEVSVPEPNPALLTSLGLIGISLVSRRARRKALAMRAA